MKKLLYLLIAILFTSCAVPHLMETSAYNPTQNNDEDFETEIITSSDGKKQLLFNEIKPDSAVSKSYELDYMRYCISRYHNARLKAYTVGGVSLAITYASTQFEGDDRNAVLVLGGITGITSAVMFVTAEKWLKRSSIKPSPNGLGVIIEF